MEHMRVPLLVPVLQAMMVVASPQAPTFNPTSNPTAEEQNSTSSFVVPAFINACIGVGVLLAFCLLRNRFPVVYNPRTNSMHKIAGAADPLPAGFLNWIPALIKIDEATILQTSGVDAVLYIRFFSMCLRLFASASVYGRITKRVTFFCMLHFCFLQASF